MHRFVALMLLAGLRAGAEPVTISPKQVLVLPDADWTASHFAFRRDGDGSTAGDANAYGLAHAVVPGTDKWGLCDVYGEMKAEGTALVPAKQWLIFGSGPRERPCGIAPSETTITIACTGLFITNGTVFNGLLYEDPEKTPPKRKNILKDGGFSIEGTFLLSRPTLTDSPATP